MPREAHVPGSSEEWLARAKSNLARAHQPKPEEVFWEDVCFDAQQAVEKALKALMLHKEIPFRFVHDIGELLSVLKSKDVSLPVDVLESAELTEYAVEARYPGPFEPVTADEAAQAVRIAETVVAWVESLTSNASP